MDKARDPNIVRSSRPPRAPGSIDFGVSAVSCSRFLVGDGPRNVEELLSTVPTTTATDYYGAGGVVTELEAEVATLLGKPSALFLPTGTMAQQATLRVHADRRSSKSIAFHPCCHLETHEERGYQRLHGLFGVPVGSRHEPLSLANLRNVSEPVAALLLELPQRDLGGTLPTWKELGEQVSWARERGAAVHLDGARLWEAAPYYAKTQQKSLADVAGLFDSVYVSFYKGLGAIAGCCVAGEADVIDELSVWRTRHGGRTFMMWPYAASALTVLRERPAWMATYYRHALAIARELREIEGVEVLPERVQSPMMHLRLSASVKEIRQRVRAIAQKQKIMTFARPYTSEGPTLQRFELQVGRATMAFTPREAAHLVAQLVGAAPIR
jgi:threonine aldolase